MLGGEVWQIRGENGSGKTSLMRCMSGLAPQSFEGDLTRTDSLLYLGHKAGVKADLTVLENLRLQLVVRCQRTRLIGYKHSIM